MKTIRIWGYSDDVVCIVTRDSSSGVLSDEEMDGGTMTLRIFSDQTEENISVLAKYGEGPAACWVIAPFLTSEGDTMPDWNFRYEQEHDYSLALLMDVPNDTMIIEV